VPDEAAAFKGRRSDRIFKIVPVPISLITLALELGAIRGSKMRSDRPSPVMSHPETTFLKLVFIAADFSIPLREERILRANPSFVGISAAKSAAPSPS
jgi:hypothetical protein